MNELAERGRQDHGRDIQIKYMPLPQDDPKQRQPNIDAPARLIELGADRAAVAEGLRKTVAYFAERM